jgi:methylglutaconyl-CoA hydratase
MLEELKTSISYGLQHPDIKVLILNANGRFFSAGADLNEMQAAIDLPMAENIAHAKLLADVLALWYKSHKPTMCVVQGPAFGGALGFIAASDVAIACKEASFCFSEAKLGIMPAIISPYILKCMGIKTTRQLFLSAQLFDSAYALAHQLIDHIVDSSELEHFANEYAKQWLDIPQETMSTIKQWLLDIEQRPIDQDLIDFTSKTLAHIRTQPVAQQRLKAFFLSTNMVLLF